MIGLDAIILKNRTGSCGCFRQLASASVEFPRREISDALQLGRDFSEQTPTHTRGWPLTSGTFWGPGGKLADGVDPEQAAMARPRKKSCSGCWTWSSAGGDRESADCSNTRRERRHFNSGEKKRRMKMGGIVELLGISWLLFLLLFIGNGHCRGERGEEEHAEWEVYRALWGTLTRGITGGVVHPQLLWRSLRTNIWNVSINVSKFNLHRSERTVTPTLAPASLREHAGERTGRSLHSTLRFHLI